MQTHFNSEPIGADKQEEEPGPHRGRARQRSAWAAPGIYGLAIDGERGVREVIANLKADFDLTMGLSDCKSIGEIGRESVCFAVSQL